MAFDATTHTMHSPSLDSVTVWELASLHASTGFNPQPVTQGWTARLTGYHPKSTRVETASPVAADLAAAASPQYPAAAESAAA